MIQHLDDQPLSTLPRSNRSRLLEQLESSLQAMPETLAALLPQLGQGATLAEIRGVPPEELEQMYRMAYELCESESWRDALTVLLHLVALDNLDARFHFAAGICLQQLGEPACAVLSFGQALMLDPSDPACAFRLAETLEAVGQAEQAIELSKASLELMDAAADDSAHHLLRAAAQAQLTRLRSAHASRDGG